MRKKLKLFVLFVVIVLFGFSFYFLNPIEKGPSVSSTVKEDFSLNLTPQDLGLEDVQTQVENFDVDQLIDSYNNYKFVEVVDLKTKKEVEELYKDITMYEVPRKVLKKLPDDFKIETVDDQTLFIKVLTAVVLAANEPVFFERKILLSLNNKLRLGLAFTEKENAFFDQMVQKYDAVFYKSKQAQMADLVYKIDTMPVSLGVSVGILQSNWGQRNQKVMFSEQAWLDNNTYDYKPFDSLLDAASSFILQVNTRSNMVAFREKRLWMRRFEDQDFLGRRLAEDLDFFIDGEIIYGKKLFEVFNLGFIKELDYACFKGFCEEAQK